MYCMNSIRKKIYQIFILFSISNLVLTSFSIWLKRHKNVHSFPFALTNSSSLLYFTQNSKKFNLLLNIRISFGWRKYFPILGSLFPKKNVLILFVKTSINLSSQFDPRFVSRSLRGSQRTLLHFYNFA